jgi:asparagine synthase (glutamine-hydrolysing)
MCGITGSVGFNRENDYIDKMVLALKHRGPDAGGVWKDELCSLGHRRLSIIDLSENANQPMVSHDERFVMVYNGEVYNFKEIAAELKMPMKTSSDTEVILEAFAKWGTDFVNRLNGMFAIAIWDKARKQLFLFRDRIGIKPIYYFHQGEKFAFASELKSLLAHTEISDSVDVNRKAVYHFLHVGYIPQPLTIYNRIHKFPQGCYGVFREGEFEIRSYWKPEEQIKPELLKDEDVAYDQLHELLRDSVRKRLMSDVPYGTFLSGGIDSSVVTAIARSVSDEPLNTFSIGFSDARFNESVHAKRIAECLGTKHHEFILEEKDAINILPELNDIYDEPFSDSSAIPTLLVSQMARRHVTMTLSGDGGDELFMGYGAYRWAQRLHHPFWKLMKRPVTTILKQGNNRMKRAAWLFDFNHQTNLQSHIFSQEQYFFSVREIIHLWPEINDFEEVQLNSGHEHHRKLTPSEQQALFDLKYYLPDDLLAKVDRASMYHSLETRVPLLDYRIVEFVLNLAPDLKLRNGQTKYLLKKILYNYVPSEFFSRPKQGFSIPLARWMRAEMKDYVFEHLHSFALNQMLERDVNTINSVKQWKEGNDLFYNRVWLLVVLGRWLEKYRKG